MSFSSFSHACHKQDTSSWALQGKDISWKQHFLMSAGGMLKIQTKQTSKNMTLIIQCTIIPSLGNFNASDYIKSSEKSSLISLNAGFSKLYNHRTPGLYGAWSKKHSLNKQCSLRWRYSGSIRQYEAEITW